MKTLVLVLGNQLFPVTHYQSLKDHLFFMAEDEGLCRHFRYHKHKIFLFLSAMRHWAKARSQEGFKVHYSSIAEHDFQSAFEDKLSKCVISNFIEKIVCFEIEDKFFEERIKQFCKKHGLKLELRSSPMFICSRAGFQEYLKAKQKPFMKTFYERQRRQLGILMTHEGEPVGGRFSYDDENRAALPKGIRLPSIPKVSIAPEDLVLVEQINTRFPDHPGNLKDFWLPTTFQGAIDWLNDFLEKRFADFGPYEDALHPTEMLLFHSGLAPLMNLGLLPPDLVIERALNFAESHKIPINSAEGFVRQVVGWREFMRGIYQNFSERLEGSNQWGAHLPLGRAFYDGTTGIEPLDAVIRKVMKHAYAHHIERLMVLANIMNLAGIEPREVYRWFMELFVDSSDWVMSPNVYGMGLVSCGGIFATKPYICGSNYWIKMGFGPKTPCLEGVDALYWSFIDQHRAFFEKNPRMAVMPKSYDRMDAKKKTRLKGLAQELKAHLSAQ